MKRLLLVLVALALAAPALADVTMKMTMTTAGGPMSVNVTSTTYIKGGKMRVDADTMGRQMTVVVDVPAKTALTYDHTNKQIEPVSQVGGLGQLPMEFGEAVVSLKPNGQVKDLLGQSCAGYDLTVSLPLTLNGETVTMRMAGLAWVVAKGPVVEEYRAFYRSSLAAGLYAAPGAQGPTAKAFVEMQKAMTEAGIPIEQDMQVSFEGTGQMAQAMGQMQLTMVMKVTSILTDPVADDLFAAPVGYTRK